jgi:serine/threonine protein phosphatase PrpC
MLSSDIAYSDMSIETDFSGTTFTCCVIRGNRCLCANIGDSRSTIGFRNESGGITGIALTQDHKPDLPAEKVEQFELCVKLFRLIPCSVGSY